MRRLVLYLWFLLIVRPIVRLVMGVTVCGREYLRFDGPAIIVANHNSHLDAAVLMDLLPLGKLHTVRPVAAADYFEKRCIVHFIFRYCMNVLPIRRDKVTRKHHPMRAMAEALDAGESILLFPEGTRGEPETMSRFQTGIARLAASRPEVPVIPVYMHNLGFSLPRGEFVLVPMFCDVYIGAPRHLNGDRDQIMASLALAFEHLRIIARRHRELEPPEDDR